MPSCSSIFLTTGEVAMIQKHTSFSKYQPMRATYWVQSDGVIPWLRRILFDDNSGEGSCCLSPDRIPSHLELAHGVMEVPCLYSQGTNKKVAIESSTLPRLKPTPRGLP